MMALADFLLARIAEDEAAARAATSREWRVDGYGLIVNAQTGAQVCPGGGINYDEGPRADDAKHIARFHPARVLADCAAKRRIVLSAGDAMRAYDANPASGDEVRDEAVLTAVNIYEEVLRAYAEPYADHPDYREEW